MVKGAEDVRDAPPGQPDNTRDADVDEIHLVELAFTWYSTSYEKIKYEPMLTGISGGEDTKRKEAVALLKAISGKAVEWATKILNSYNEAEKEMTSQNSKKPP
ncbi:hypothetical protein CYMTET_3045 [Cymbomonas tetramitiformis]|uniref:Uncharacterized protein n=1 Tax=Cymbomonas tetramitiformis TaxID=36881 RepID=A0AAE0H4H8_9CHLO|nr:hypothetical protein CYMTET_3045 [Cymbomonas tetramitiformis]